MHATTPAPGIDARLAERTRPEGHVVMHQRWEHLLFLHWRWDAASIQATLPAGLTVDTWDGVAWVGLVPLFMRHVRPPMLPPLGPLSNFLELNLRTYVYDAAGRPGIYFYALECDQPLAVAGGRLADLNYQAAEMNARVDEHGWVEFESRRASSAERAGFRYRPRQGDAILAKADSLEFFLIERYRLFAADESGPTLETIRVHHAPYRLMEAHVEVWSDAPLRHARLGAPGRTPDHICAAEAVSLEVFAPEKAAPPRGL